MLSTGAELARLTCPGADLSGVHYLRGIGDVTAIRDGLKAGARVVIIGGGYIGLETAATARHLGCAVTVLEMADRVMNRVVAPACRSTSPHEHHTHGVKIVCNTRVIRLEGTGSVERVLARTAASYAADLVIVGVGRDPDTELAAQRDSPARTASSSTNTAAPAIPRSTPPGIAPIIRRCRFGMRVRLESVDNAFEQAQTAALNILDRATVHDRVPWFWSDQFDNKLLIVGLSQGFDGR